MATLTPPAAATRRLSNHACELSGSQILRVAAEVRAHAAEGHPTANLTVGDFAPAEFPIPQFLRDAIIDALKAGETNYPASYGVDQLRAAIQDFYRRSFGTEYATDQILVTSGSRPVIYATYRSLIDRGDRVVFGVPSWNNEYYCQMTGAEQVRIPCDESTNFLPTVDMVAPHLPGARMLALNSPLNPTGTVFEPDVLASLLDAVIEENERRGPDDRPLYLMFDQVYWMITVDGVTHTDPLSIRPEIAPYLVSADGISKAFAATGLRVGWALGPSDVIRAMSDFLSHAGTWAPRAEQIATAKFLSNAEAVDGYIEWIRQAAASRLQSLAEGLRALGHAGLPVECVTPQGAIYLSARFPLMGRRTPDGEVLRTNEQIRRYLLTAAGLGAIAFQAFGMDGDSGWFRLSVGVASPKLIDDLIPRIRKALEALSA